MKERPDWDGVVYEVEAEYQKKLWSEVGKRSGEMGGEVVNEHGLDSEVDFLLDEISKEQTRTNPDGNNTIDQEEVWRMSGDYPTFVWGEPDENEDLLR